MSRTEQFLTALLNGETVDITPRSRLEQYLKNCCDKCGCGGLPTPKSRAEVLLYQLAQSLAGDSSGGGGGGTGENRLAMFISGELTEVTAADFGGVTSIAQYQFYRNKKIVSVEIPNDIESIGKDAFYDCTNLKSVYIADLAKWCGIGFYSYGSNPLYYAKNLYLNKELVTELVIPNSVTSVRAHAFQNCMNLTSITIPNSVTTISDAAFAGCSSLASITIPDSVTKITGSAFAGCSSLASITIGSGMINFNTLVFSNCTELKTIVLRSNSLVSLGNVNALQGTPFAVGGTGGTVYCYAEFIESYKTATNWSALYEAGTCNFVAIEGSEYE